VKLLCLLSAGFPICLYLVCQVATVFTSVSQTFSVVNRSWVQEMAVDPHILGHVCVDCPDHSRCVQN
jgi:hypothetical protein